MPKPRSSALESATSRRKLQTRKKPYWLKLSPGIALGYRRNEGPGTWSVRSSDGYGRLWEKRLALADDLEAAAPPHVLTFWDAQKIEPKFYADVEYRDITTEGLLRASSFKGLIKGTGRT